MIYKLNIKLINLNSFKIEFLLLLVMFGFLFNYGKKKNIYKNENTSKYLKALTIIWHK